ncbi:pentapeptide repeat-containing protein [Rhodococcus sp. ARC_M6]|uniref:pentapeptide repeat-containing protein n=1 Tax=Rhodococcus sp. ARC_M6 TaxID=2928852 RepID=UPI001FB25249|nr:pentapeptide repeat-containing protein [Rhodococcus sp. ARC_M6]MCJ0907334.1 pentapeptide repeat-containing protein [Rhodococcus sp. ARC_M6]
MLRRLLLHGHLNESTKEISLNAVSVRGAIITDELDLSDESISVRLTLDHCKIEGIDATRTTFTQRAEFSGANFIRTARFERAIFSQVAWFDKTTFAQNADFEGATFTEVAWFDKTTFIQDASFNKATFAELVSFRSATFSKDAWFSELTFDADAWFRGAYFTQFAVFDKTTFAQDAAFRDAAFAHHTSFSEATFTQEAGFDKTTFAQEASFREATFTRKASFNSAIAHLLNFSEAVFNSPELGSFAAETVCLDGTKFRSRIRFTALCKSLNMAHAQFDEGGHLQVRGASITFPGAEFLARTIIADPGDAPFTDEFFSAAEVTMEGELAEGLKALRGTKTSITDLRSANVKDMVLSSINLTDCHFLGAHGIDTLRIDSSCDMRSSKELPGRWRLPNSRRKIIVEELNFRKPNHRTSATPTPAIAATADTQTLQEGAPAAALDIATIYRDLRRGLESSKNEPGAADFYYGEMEMRRRSTDTAWAERVLLWLYWAVSGYGLRALRAFSMVALVIVGAGVIFSTVGIAPPSDPAAIARSIDVTAEMIVRPPEVPTVVDASTLPDSVAAVSPTTAVPSVSVTRSTGVITDPTPEPQEPPNIGDGFELAARNSVVLLRNPGDRVALTPVGTVTDITLRLLTPVLLGLGLLALRGRTKR